MDGGETCAGLRLARRRDGTQTAGDGGRDCEVFDHRRPTQKARRARRQIWKRSPACCSSRKRAYTIGLLSARVPFLHSAFCLLLSALCLFLTDLWKSSPNSP